jgi:hypothetical protein
MEVKSKIREKEIETALVEIVDAATSFSVEQLKFQKPYLALARVPLLKRFYNPDDILNAGFDHECGETMTVTEWPDGRNNYQSYLIPNPVTEEGHQYRFAVVAMSKLEREEKVSRGTYIDRQAEFWSGILNLELLNVAYLIDDGENIYAWIEINCPDADTWDRDVRHGLFDKWLKPMGCDEYGGEPNYPSPIVSTNGKSEHRALFTKHLTCPKCGGWRFRKSDTPDTFWKCHKCDPPAKGSSDPSRPVM